MFRIVEKLIPVAASLGATVGAGTVIYRSDRRDTFLDCVGQVTMGTIMGGAVGTLALFFSPLLLAGTVLGGPMYAYQRFRFPPTPPGKSKSFFHETRVGPVLISRELS